MHIVLLLFLPLLVSSHPCELCRCPMHLFCYFMRDKLIAIMPCFLHAKQTNVFQCMLFMIFGCRLSCFMLSYYVLLLELHLSCTCLEFFDPRFQCFEWLDVYCEGACHLNNYYFYHLPTRE